MKSPDNASLIAPCGMNCNICVAYLREKNKCPGCRGPDDNKPVTRWKCKIKTCDVFQKEGPQFCFKCAVFPCKKLKALDKRYRTKYHMRMIENLEYIRDCGIMPFLENEKSKWTCSGCGGTVCVHKGYCYSCGERKVF
ncbi:DUF3795 domain-containing protein [Methanolobus chelungpuianus]|uniref:DUF3795 domain-containing protein n=1 Tax=Methanolobus chelungpuianus TaxID=502115 RepID=A0AAE3H8P6_9EURY|nr:hypothetical protein [Methanolobus chelungpuianus]